ncbi:hypothetical protein MRX96_057772 [Rhipicephalus microplus]
MDVPARGTPTSHRKKGKKPARKQQTPAAPAGTPAIYSSEGPQADAAGSATSVRPQAQCPAVPSVPENHRDGEGPYQKVRSKAALQCAKRLAAALPVNPVVVGTELNGPQLPKFLPRHPPSKRGPGTLVARWLC